MKIKLKERQSDANWRKVFVVFKNRTQDNYRVFFEKIWMKDDVTTGKQIYRYNHPKALVKND